MSMTGVRRFSGTVAAGITDIVEDPEWVPHTFNPAGDTLIFVRVPREVREANPFLDGALLEALDRVSLPYEAVQQVQLPDLVHAHFVFHTALCGSTLLAKALGAVGNASVLKEPGILLNLYFRFQRGNEEAEIPRLDLALSLLARPFGGSNGVVVKPTCMVGPLIPHIMRLRPKARAILLHTDIRSFLLAVAKRGIKGRSWGRRVFANCRRAIPLEFGYDADETLEHTDLQVAGLAWLMRGWLFDRIAANLGPDRILQIGAGDLYGNPEATLKTTSAFFGMASDPGTIQSILRGPIFNTHSKEAGRPFEKSDRESEFAALSETHGEEVEIVVKWLRAVAEQRGLRMD